jgi:hypothetical protein
MVEGGVMRSLPETNSTALRGREGAQLGGDVHAAPGFCAICDHHCGVSVTARYALGEGTLRWVHALPTHPHGRQSTSTGLENGTIICGVIRAEP